MADNTQSQSTVNILPEGFVVRGRDGQLKIVRGGRLEAFSPGTGAGLQKRGQEIIEHRVVPAPMPLTQQPQIHVEALQVVPTAPSPVASPPPSPSYQMPSSPPAPSVQLPSALTPQKPISSSGKPSYFVEPEDEEDIALHREKILQLAPASQPSFDIDRTLAAIILRNNVVFADDVMEKRFYQIVRSRLIEMRNSTETEEALLRSPKIGGMGFEQGLVRRLLIDIEEEAQNIVSLGTLGELQGRFRAPIRHEEPEAPYKPVIPFPTPHPSVPPAPERPASPPDSKSFTHLILARKEAAIAQPPLVVPLAVEPPKTPSPPVTDVQKPVPVVQPRPVERVSEEASVKIPITEAAAALPSAPPVQIPVQPSVSQAPVEVMEPKVEQKPQTIIRPEALPSRPRVTDIIQAPTKHSVTGPIDELAEMTLEDFRRYGSSMEEIKTKVLSKIELLEEESYAKRFAGIKAWRRSPVFQLYLDMGRASIEDNQSISDIITARVSKRQGALTSEEFEAIADMNIQLRY
ncbi:MAG: hypothetical protein A2898_03850 [Candidatus Kerfeldbacteria bacterium RIFCSPLOWO2_01_FULL_48_11]|uniref:Uncharacterized protein n=1 Tax=Candidatus Kerfeldbacteria bacterium RIFCSPLOWO2_01_FULL_48_11 TaxID=1798543 RepID=A0A1G2B6M6_9BACT|nr:MAG: hypothetical protein UY34_C0025G0008 [Parcubacteria group bacterium GW2011_GWA2_48_9]KKW14436.1 MAG: hypothetical protein UY52_C0028G0007 [Parcubacteria group bacterium GW2011_GWC2_49_9]OGY84821.1 MAG: hypothetical protein A2898_03850 [Candidatus Kerfeldbacteria bacterium RIFCSPLOWO2_01_FULL_48_11]HCJ52609.1 hypothetical protein [Candidatus Kerfeldbacteria bacterium]HCM67548.1 hypothetical protein [Candidatus Kerfeldbacteria bacterium]